MRRIVFLATWTIAILLASGVCLASLSAAEVSPQAVKKPNIVFILADDMRYDDLKYMPKTQALLGAKGMRFQECTSSPNALCCSFQGHHHARPVLPQHRSVDQPYDSTRQDGWQGPTSMHGNEKDNVATRLRGRRLQDRALRQVPERLRKHHFCPSEAGTDWFAKLQKPQGDLDNYFDY